MKARRAVSNIIMMQRLYVPQRGDISSGLIHKIQIDTFHQIQYEIF